MNDKRQLTGGSMNDWTAAQAAEEWGLTVRRVQTLCIKGRVPGASNAEGSG